MKTVVYTAITDKRNPVRKDILCFTDNLLFREKRRNARIFKVLSHLFVEADYSIWVDGRVFLKVLPDQLINLLDDKEVLIFRHPNWDCIYKEAEVVLNAKLDDIEIVEKQMERYKNSGYPENHGLAMTGIIVRKHTDKIKRLNEQWWSEICRGSSRDQLSFNYVFPDSCIKYVDWQGSYNNDYFYREDHKTSISQKIRKYILSPIKQKLLKSVWG
jgi:hypothetical protein